ncbi:hypothetical protein [Pseudoduganella chitinolytica]|uniref:CopL family metal-binding regulatory protein n=1 Tax=Pseudoduganella chitinolytica TaxID=34070 RepID=A0ABY8BJ51_9BURK|nr:hypothetical protein [Pseudoduganella chitinolytica]WEF34978.1 hypothetical protein PX653_09505 [Pseudoduganella chitinolytica]
MNALLRTFVLWLLLAGVPLQGFASATMLLCAPGTDATAQPHHAGHGQQEQAPQADVQHEHVQQHGHDGANADHDKAAAHHGSDLKCASAASCCTGAPLAGAMTVPPPLPASGGAPIPFETAAPPVVDLAGLERPPKRLA